MQVAARKVATDVAQKISDELSASLVNSEAFRKAYREALAVAMPLALFKSIDDRMRGEAQMVVSNAVMQMQAALRNGQV